MTVFWITVFACWAAAMAAWWAVGRMARNAQTKRMKQRLMGGAAAKPAKAPAAAPSLIQTEEAQTGKLVLSLLSRLQLAERLRRLIEQAGLRWNPARLIHACLTLFLIAFAATWHAAPGPFGRLAPVSGLVAGALPLLYVVRRRRRRLKAFEEQFPESLEFVARSMRAGHAFSVSLEMLHREFQEPLAGEFRRTFEEHNLGIPLEAALEKLAGRVPSMDVHFFVAAVLLQKRTGGNLAELLDKLAGLIRERFKLRGRIRAISAHGRMTGAALSTIPVVVAAIMFYVNPDYVRFFVNDTTGQWMMGGAVALQLIGYGVIKKIVAIEV